MIKARNYRAFYKEENDYASDVTITLYSEIE